MKEQVNPAVFIGIIVAVIAIACFFGIRALMPDTSGTPNKTHGMTEEQKAQYESMHNRSQGAPGGPSGASYQQYQQMQRQHQGGR